MLLIYKHQAPNRITYKCNNILSTCVITNLFSTRGVIALWLKFRYVLADRSIANFRETTRLEKLHVGVGVRESSAYQK